MIVEFGFFKGGWYDGGLDQVAESAYRGINVFGIDDFVVFVEGNTASLSFSVAGSFFCVIADAQH